MNFKYCRHRVNANVGRLDRQLWARQRSRGDTSGDEKILDPRLVDTGAARWGVADIKSDIYIYT